MPCAAGHARCPETRQAPSAATDQRSRPAPESLTVRSKSFAHGAYATTMMGDVCAPLGSILWCCVCLLRVPSASDHVCTALRGGQRRRPAPEPNDTKCRGFGDGGTAQMTLGDARTPSQSCGAASFYLERRARPFIVRSAVLLGPKTHFHWARHSGLKFRKPLFSS